MIQGCEHSGFAIETASALSIRIEDARKDLDRDIATELRIVRTIYVAHATGPKEPEDPMGTKLSAHERLMQERVSRQLKGGFFEKLSGVAFVRQERFDLSTECLVASGRLVQKRRAFGRRPLERRFEQAIDRCPTWILHF